MKSEKDLYQYPDTWDKSFGSEVGPRFSALLGEGKTPADVRALLQSEFPKKRLPNKNMQMSAITRWRESRGIVPQKPEKPKIASSLPHELLCEESDSCDWSLTEPCPEPKKPGKPYCEEHCKRAYAH